VAAGLQRRRHTQLHHCWQKSRSCSSTEYRPMAVATRREPSPPYHYKSSAVAEMGDHGHNRHGPKRRGCCAPLAGKKLGPRLTQCGLGRRLLPYQVASSSIQPFGRNRHGPKERGAVFLLGGAGSPSNTTSPGPRPISVPSGILIHPAVWPQ